MRESIPVGITYYGSDEIDEFIEQFGNFWYGRDYDPFAKNCNHFTEAFIKTICNKEQFYVPHYINRFCKLGSILRMWFKPLQELFGDIVNYNDEDKHEESNNSEDLEMGQFYFNYAVTSEQHRNTSQEHAA